MTRFIIFALALLISFGSAQTGGSTAAFCRLVGHGSVSKAGTIFVNGGIQTVIQNGSIISGILDTVLELDTTTSWIVKKNLTFASKPKTLSGSVSGYTKPLIVNSGAFFGGRWSQSILWQFGGTSTGFNTSATSYQRAPNTKYALWKYDGNQLWSAIDTSTTQITVPSYGSYAEAPGQGLGFYLGGQVNNGTADTTQTLGNSTVKLGGLVVVDTDNGRLTNLTVPTLVNSNRRGAGLEYIGIYGNSGILIMMGGHDGVALVSLEQVAVFDVNSLDTNSPTATGPNKNTWFMQTTTGQIPSLRRDFCLVHIPSQDNSSVNIYLYGGRGYGSYYDEVYVLSLPSFTWTKVYDGNLPRYLHTCNRAGKRQMISIGGAGNSSDFTTDCDLQTAGVGVFDMSTLSWNTSYDAYAQPYLVPSPVLAVIGGTGTGGATKVTPVNGFVNDNLATLLATRNSISPYAPSPNNTNTGSESEQGHDTSSLSTAALVGISISIGIVVLGGFGLVWYLVKRRKERKSFIKIPSIHESGGQEKHEISSLGTERSELNNERVRGELSGNSTRLRSPEGNEWELTKLQTPYRYRDVELE